MHAKKLLIGGTAMLACLCLTACKVGPNYQRPAVDMPVKYKEAKKGWKIAEPKDDCYRGAWWKAFHDAKLDALEEKLDNINFSIATAYSQYMQARYMVDEASASLFPLVDASISLSRQKTGSAVSSSAATSGAASTLSTPSGAGNPSTTHNTFLSATWEPDLWGAIRRNIEASADAAQASAASWALVKLTSQATLAQDYFQLIALDNLQKVLDETVADYKKTVQLTKNRYASGVAGQADVVQAQSQLENAEALAINNGVNRAVYEHAIAVLIGVPPAEFSLAARPRHLAPPTIPVGIPSMLLERRPDVAQAERLMAQANAQIGVAISAYFPALTLSGTGSVTKPYYSNWFSYPALSWSLGGQFAETLFDGGLRSATVSAARANYDAAVATYRQTVLTAFQNVEDNLATLRILNRQNVVERQALVSARKALQIVINEYKSGTAEFIDVLVAQVTEFTAAQAVVNVEGQQMVAAAGLIKALGGGWDVSSIDNAAG